MRQYPACVPGLVLNCTGLVLNMCFASKVVSGTQIGIGPCVCVTVAKPRFYARYMVPGPCQLAS